MYKRQGIIVTASHNPAKYNGYKVYGSDGCQVTLEAAEKILGEIAKLNIFAAMCIRDRPILENFFDVTTDFLLEVDASSSEKEIE